MTDLDDLEDDVFTKLDEARRDLAKAGLLGHWPDEGEARGWLEAIADFAGIPSAQADPVLTDLLDRWLDGRLSAAADPD